jgi:hypothetical protein
LSKLQKFIMVALLAPKHMAMSRREFSKFVYGYWFSEDSPSARASLSRAYRRLEDRGFLKREHGQWRLTTDLDDNGFVVASLVALEITENSKSDALGSR